MWLLFTKGLLRCTLRLLCFIKSGCGAAEARLFWEQEVVGSIPTTPTILEVIDFTATRDGEPKSLQEGYLCGLIENSQRIYTHYTLGEVLKGELCVRCMWLKFGVEVGILATIHLSYQYIRIGRFVAKGQCP